MLGLRSFLLCLVMWAGMSIPAHGQVDGHDPGLDARLLFRLHQTESAAVGYWMGGADHSAYPVFATVIPAAFIFGSRDQAASVSVSMVAALGSAFVLKRIMQRERPYSAFPDIQPRAGYPGTRHLSPSASFPSGHAAIAAALATSVALSSRSPWLIAGGSVWAASVAGSRVWLGVHYPGDVIAGSVIGVGLGFLAHTLIE